MVKAVFIDYMGTTVEERSSEMAEIVQRICKNSSVHDPKQVQRFILDTRRSYEADSYRNPSRSDTPTAFSVSRYVPKQGTVKTLR